MRLAGVGSGLGVHPNLIICKQFHSNTTSLNGDSFGLWDKGIVIDKESYKRTREKLVPRNKIPRVRRFAPGPLPSDQHIFDKISLRQRNFVACPKKKESQPASICIEYPN